MKRRLHKKYLKLYVAALQKVVPALSDAELDRLLNRMMNNHRALDQQLGLTGHSGQRIAQLRKLIEGDR